jgi:hypothetical protein
VRRFGILVQMGRRTPLRTGCQARAPPFFRTREQSKKEAAFGYACALTMCACLYSADSTISKNFRRTCLECPSDTYQDETGHRKSDCKVQFETCSVGESISADSKTSRRTCSACPPNTYQDETGHANTECKACTGTLRGCTCEPGYSGKPCTIDSLMCSHEATNCTSFQVVDGTPPNNCMCINDFESWVEQRSGGSWFEQQSWLGFVLFLACI